MEVKQYYPQWYYIHWSNDNRSKIIEKKDLKKLLLAEYGNKLNKANIDMIRAFLEEHGHKLLKVTSNKRFYDKLTDKRYVVLMNESDKEKHNSKYS